MKQDFTTTFIDQNCGKPPKNLRIKKIFCIHIHKIWFIHMADKIDYKSSNKKGFRYTFVVIDNFSENTWSIRLVNKNAQTITDDFREV